MGTYAFTCQLSYGGLSYEVAGSIDENGSVTVKFYEFTPAPATSRGTRIGSRNPARLNKGKLLLGKTGKMLFSETLVFGRAVSDRQVGEFLQRRLAKYLGRPASKVKVDGVSLHNRDHTRGGRADGPVVYNYICHVRRGDQKFVAVGQVTDKVTLTLSEGDPHPSGGGLIGADRLVDTIPLGKSVDTSSYRKLEKPVAELIQRRVAKHLRCAPRMVTVFDMRIGPARTEGDQRTQAAKKKKPPRKGW